MAVVATLNLSGCGTTAPVQSAVVAEKDAGTTASVVMSRAQQRWNALLKRDMEGAYQFISPGGRSLMSLEDYRPRLNTGFWRGATVKEAKCAGETCEVTVAVDMVVEGVKFTNPIQETWILDAGKWWFVYRG
ncbi:MAG: hypothetical protein LH618_06205 [Saprospiraceae bacterium]|nr:hypothetical protein [Saprospiraceae bacterium]